MALISRDDVYIFVIHVYVNNKIYVLNFFFFIINKLKSNMKIYNIDKKK